MEDPITCVQPYPHSDTVIASPPGRLPSSARIYLSSPENITEKLQQTVAQFSKGRDRTVWWNEGTKTNVHPFNEDVTDFFELPWQDKVR